ncbi:MAG: C25 family cysteine peptidase [Patescibacteria group bacterium]
MPKLLDTNTKTQEQLKIKISIAAMMLAAVGLGFAFGIILIDLASKKIPTVSTGNFTVSFAANEYKFSEIDSKGNQTVSMVDFENRGLPGEPDMPMKTYSILLPPGAQFIKADIISMESSLIDGSYVIKEAPTPQPIIDSTSADILYKEAAEIPPKQEIYSSDQLYPVNVIETKQAGQMRKYNIQEITFNPFQYQPLSKKLTFISKVNLRITYNIGEAPTASRLADTVLDDSVRELAYNFNQFGDQYDTSLVNTKSPAELYDYVIIAPQTMASSAGMNTLVQYRQNQGHSIHLETTEYISSNYSGADLPEKIRNYLISHYLDWGIKNVALVGSNQVIPMRVCDGYLPTDYYYQELTSVWDGSQMYCGYHDWYPEVFVGRIPIDDTAQFAQYIDRVITYENTTDPYIRKALLAAGIWETNNDAAQTAENLRIGLFLPAGYQADRLYEETGTCPATLLHDDDVSQVNVLDNWQNEHYGIVYLAAHGNPARLCSKPCPQPDQGCQTTFVKDDISQLNGDYPSVVFSLACSTADVSDPGNLAYSLVRQKVASYVGATKVAFSSDQIYQLYFSNLLQQERRNAEALALARLSVTENYNGQYQALNYNLYSEPLLKVRTFCEDGTVGGQCSGQQYCDKGQLVSDCRQCGFTCSGGRVCDIGSGQCIMPPACNIDSDCADSIACNVDHCNFSGTISASCSHTGGTCCANGTLPGQCDSAGGSFCTSNLTLDDNRCPICGCKQFYKCNPGSPKGTGSCVPDPTTCCLEETPTCKLPLCPWRPLNTVN